MCAAYYWEDRYQPDGYCIFCRKKTEETHPYQYHGVELDQKQLTLPVHYHCLKWQKIKVSFMFFLPFLLLFAGLYTVETFLLQDKLPLWAKVIYFLFGAFGALFISARLFYNWEQKIVRYVRSHTNYENHYKSDEFRWRRR